MEYKESVRPDSIFSWREERFPFTRWDAEPDEEGKRVGVYQNVEELEEELGGVPFTVFRQILMRTWAGYGEQAFIDLLNEPTSSPRHLLTFFEKEFRANERKFPGTPFFSRKHDWPYIKAKRPCDFIPKEEFSFLIELAELERWAQRNPDILPDEVAIYGSIEDAIRLEYEAALAAKDAEIERLLARVAELEKVPHKPVASGERGSAGSETASAKRIAEWKEAYIPAMVKAAIELGAEGPKPERERKQRKDIGALLDRFAVQGKALPSDHAEAVEVFRASLPDGYVNTIGGAPKSRVTKIKQ